MGPLRKGFHTWVMFPVTSGTSTGPQLPNDLSPTVPPLGPDLFHNGSLWETHSQSELWHHSYLNVSLCSHQLHPKVLAVSLGLIFHGAHRRMGSLKKGLGKEAPPFYSTTDEWEVNDSMLGKNCSHRITRSTGIQHHLTNGFQKAGFPVCNSVKLDLYRIPYTETDPNTLKRCNFEECVGINLLDLTVDNNFLTMETKG